MCILTTQGFLQKDLIIGIHYYITMLCFLNGDLFESIFITFVTLTKSTLALTDLECRDTLLWYCDMLEIPIISPSTTIGAQLIIYCSYITWLLNTV